MAKVVLEDLSLEDFTLGTLPRLRELRRLSFERSPEICIERAHYVTEYLRDMDDPADDPEVRQAKKVRHFLINKQPIFHDLNLLAGGTTSKPLGAPLFPEFFATTLWPELDTVSKRSKNPQKLTKEEARRLNFDILPFWMERNVVEVARKRFNSPLCQKLFERLVFYIAGKAGCISHCVPTYEPMLQKGLLGISAEAAERQAALAGKTDPESLKQAAFYRAMQIALDGIMSYSLHLAEHAEGIAQTARDPELKRQYEEMAAVCRRAPAHPAGTFREAVNAIWISQVAIHAENINMAMSPGRLDQVLYPYYERDIREGRLDVGQAIELIGCLWLKLTDNVAMVPETSEELFGGAGTVPAVTLGGVDAEGNDAVNDLTYIMLRVTELLRIRDPNVNARYHYEKNSEEYLRRVSEVILSTRAVPAMYNDVVNIATLVNQGEQIEHARDYGVVGCVELASSGRDYSASSSVILNLAAPLEMSIYGGKCPLTGEDDFGPPIQAPQTMGKFDEFWTAFTTRLDWLIGQAIEFNEMLGAVHQDIMPSPLLSAFFHGPMEKGMDLIWGGAMYNSSGATHIGFADVVDSLSAIEELVFNKKTYTFSELARAIEANFQGDEYKKMHLSLQNSTPRYGTMNEKAVANSTRLIDHLYQVYQSRKNYRGGPYRPAYWTMTNHAGFGSMCGAMPHGRLANEVMASGITPVSGKTKYLTECLNAVSLLAGNHVPGGWALNLKYTPSNDPEKAIEPFARVIEGYFKPNERKKGHSGGHQVQFNIMTYNMLLDAKKHPEKYPELMVRVSGYSAYFKDLNELMQNELILRTQYDLGTLEAVPFYGQLEAPKQGGGVALQNLGKWTRKLLSPVAGWLTRHLDSSEVQGILRALLLAMEGIYSLPTRFRDNIKGFEGRYLLLSKDGGVHLSILFKDGEMAVRTRPIPNPHITLTFTTGLALMKFLMAPKPDVLHAMLHHEVETSGNLNYLFKLTYMAMQLKLLGERLLSMLPRI